VTAKSLCACESKFRLDLKKKRFPRGWTGEKVRSVISHYEHQTEEETLAEDEAVFSDPTKTVIEVPRELLPAIREMIAKHQSNAKSEVRYRSSEQRSSGKLL
jgi:hypothetical protein